VHINNDFVGKHVLGLSAVFVLYRFNEKKVVKIAWELSPWHYRRQSDGQGNSE